MIVVCILPTNAQELSYTYTYDIAMNVASLIYQATVITGVDLELGDFVEPEGLFVKDSFIYICDTETAELLFLKK